MDINCDGKISLQEYKEGAMKNPDIIRKYYQINMDTKIAR